MKYINQLEPNELIDGFLSHPPQDFSAWLSDEGVPVFSANFDLLTTVDSKLKSKIVKIPFQNYWKKWLKPKTCFVGTTVSEYALLTNHVNADVLATNIKKTYSQKFPFLIIKDVPMQSPLLPNLDNQYSEQFLEALKAEGFIEIEGQALAWVPIDFERIEDFFSRFSYSRRKNFRRKLKSREKLQITTLFSGDPCFFDQKVLDEYYQLYLNVYQQSEIHFDLLTKPFFIKLLQTKENDARIFTYQSDGELIGFNICFVINNMLVDKYIGLSYPKAKLLNLYYVSWFINLEYALSEGLTRYIAGWTDPEVKASLGAKFTFTKHMVYVRNRLLRKVLRRLSSHFESDKEKIA